MEDRQRPLLSSAACVMRRLAASCTGVFSSTRPEKGVVNLFVLMPFQDRGLVGGILFVSYAAIPTSVISRQLWKRLAIHES